MNECKECELAVYCYTDSTSWTFRTVREMEEKKSAMEQCALYAHIRAGKEKQEDDNVGATLNQLAER